MPPNGNWRNGIGICGWSSSAAGPTSSLVVIETTAGFTCVTRSVKSGSAWPVMPLPGGLTGAPGVASGAAKPAWPTANPPSAVPASSTAAMAERRQSLVARGVSVESVMVPPWETSWMARAGSRIGAAVTQDNAAGRVNVPSVQRLNRCHVD